MVFIKYAFPAKVNSRDTAGLRSPLAAALSMCETPLRGTRPPSERRWNRTRRPQTHELEKLAEHLALSPATSPWSSIARASPIPSRRPQRRIFAAPANSNIVPISLPARSAPSAVLPSVSLSRGQRRLFRFRHERVEDYLLQEGYFYFVASHRHRADLIDEYPRMFLERSVDGLIASTPPGISTSLCPSSPCPDITTSRASPTLS